MELPARLTGLDQDLVAVASPHTIPRNCLLRDSLQGVLPPRCYKEIEEALKRVFGWALWPD